MQNEQRNQRMMMNNPMNAQYQNVGNMMRANMPNGVAQNDLKRAALQNNRPYARPVLSRLSDTPLTLSRNGNPMANMGQMNKPNMIAAQMQRDGSQMDMNGQRAQSPNSNENAPSPNKRARVEGMSRPTTPPPHPFVNPLTTRDAGAMNTNMPNAQFNEFGQPSNNAQQKNIEVYAQSLAQQHRVALNNTASPQAMTQGSPMNPGLDGQDIMFPGAQARPGMPPQGQPGPPQQGSHALQDYQMQLMLLEQQNKKRLLMARQEQDNMSGPHQQGAVGGQFPPAMSPSGSRAGPSPNPTDMKGRTPKLGQQGLPGSPMPEGVMQQQRGSPAPNMNFPDPSLAPPGMPPQFYPQMPNNPMMRPPSSHPGANFNGQQMSQQQMEAMRNSQMNGQWRGPPQPGMPQQPQMMGGPMAGGPQQRSQMPPPPAPSNEQRPEASPAMSNQAPPTPNQGNKAAPKKKGTKDNKVTLCAPLPTSDVDIDSRSPHPRKGQMQVQLQQSPQATKPLHLRPRHQSRRCTRNPSTRMASLSRPHNSPRRRKLSSRSNPWATTLRSATSQATLSTTLVSILATAMRHSKTLISIRSCIPAKTTAVSAA